MSVAAVLIVNGSVAQAAGVALVAWEYRDTRRRMREYRDRSKTVYASATSAMMKVGSVGLGVANSALGPADLLDRIQRLEQRVDDHENAIATVRQEAENLVERVEKRMQRRIEQTIESTRLSIMDHVTALADLLGDLNEEGWSHRRRVASVVLLITGLTAVMVGSLMAL